MTGNIKFGEWTYDTSGYREFYYRSATSRLVVEQDIYADAPDFDMSTPVYRVDGYNVEHTGHGKDSAENDGLSFDFGDVLSDLTYRLGRDTAIETLGRWLRTFYGGDVATWVGFGTLYVSYETADMRAYWGMTADTSAGLEVEVPSEWRDYVNGDVYVISRQEYDGCSFCGRGDWETVEAVGGFYGIEYAEEAALNDL